jgi:hypothetical protein
MQTPEAHAGGRVMREHGRHDTSINFSQVKVAPECTIVKNPSQEYVKNTSIF